MSIVSEYVDTARIYEEMVQALASRGIPHGDKGISKTLDIWYERKQHIIERLATHPEWSINAAAITEIGSIQVDLDKVAAMGEFTNILNDQCFCESCVGELTDKLNLHLTQTVARHLFIVIKKHPKDYILTKEYKEDILEGLPETMHKIVRVGKRVSRVLNEIFRALNLHLLTDYEKWYASLSDAFSDKQNASRLVLSVHPVDYLLMANGNSWDTCQRIPRQSNKDAGSYAGGTLSYLRDPSTIIFYTIPINSAEPYCSVPKIKRQLFHLGEDGILLQSRLYPAAGQYYEKYAAIISNWVKKVLSDTVEHKPDWKSKGGKFEYSDYVRCCPDSVHYNDTSQSCYRELYLEDKDDLEDPVSYKPVMLGGDRECLCCGTDINNYPTSRIECCDHNYVIRCVSCNFKESDKLGMYHNRNYYCQRCIGTCSDCGKRGIFRFRNIRGFNNTRFNYCSDCAHKHKVYDCTFCDTSCLSECIYDVGASKICQFCMSSSYLCEMCGEAFVIGNCDPRDFGSLFMCPACADGVSKPLPRDFCLTYSDVLELCRIRDAVDNLEAELSTDPAQGKVTYGEPLSYTSVSSFTIPATLTHRIGPPELMTLQLNDNRILSWSNWVRPVLDDE